MTTGEHEAERRGFWRGAVLVLILWIISDLAHPQWWVGFIIAVALGFAGGLISRYIDGHPRDDARAGASG